MCIQTAWLPRFCQTAGVYIDDPTPDDDEPRDIIEKVCKYAQTPSLRTPY